MLVHACYNVQQNILQALLEQKVFVR